MAYDEITVRKINIDGSIGESTSKIENGEMTFEQSSTPGPGSLPTPTPEDAGKTILVDEEGNYVLGDVAGGGVTSESIAPDYSNSSTYVVGDLVMYDGQLYECNTDISTPEEWDETHWTANSITSTVLGLINGSY